MLDGTNDRAALIEKLTAIAQGGQLNVQKDNMTIYDPNEIKQALTSVMDQALLNVARMALLVA
jgi:methyltransferase-like protein